MEKAKNLSSVPCFLHKFQTIQNVDPRPSVLKSLYCLQCVLDNDDPKSLSGNLLTLDEFLGNASIFYLTHSHKITLSTDLPSEYAEVLQSQNEVLSKLTTHLDKQKKAMEAIFQEITQVVLEQINKKKNEYIQALEEQILNTRNRFGNFEKILKKNYPKQEDLEFLFPSKQELEQRISKITDISQLASFIQSIKDDMNGKEVENLSLQEKKKQFDNIVKELKEYIAKQPFLETNNLDLKKLGISIKENLGKFLQDTLTLANSIPKHFVNTSYFDSKIIDFDESMILKEWLPPNKFTSKPILLYRSSIDGLTENAFHSKCDGKGPTMTIIKCQFRKAPKFSIIGGYLDQSWHNNNAHIASNEAFIFSLTTKTKMDISVPQHAAYGAPNFGPTFGYINLHVLLNDPNNSYANPRKQKYKNFEALIDFGNNATLSYFTPLEIEVYSLK